jgi:hypothetical protein
MYKTINKMVPDYLSSKFTPTSHSDSKLFVPARPLTACVMRLLRIEEPSCGISIADRSAVNATSVVNFKNIIGQS